MLALACAAPQLVQVWDARQVRTALSAVMSCDLPATASGGKESVYSICSVPATGGAMASQLVLGTHAGRVLMWDLRRQDALWELAHLSDKVLGCAASTCGSRVVASTNTGQVRFQPLAARSPPALEHRAGSNGAQACRLVSDGAAVVHGDEQDSVSTRAGGDAGLGAAVEWQASGGGSGTVRLPLVQPQPHLCVAQARARRASHDLCRGRSWAVSCVAAAGCQHTLRALEACNNGLCSYKRGAASQSAQPARKVPAKEQAWLSKCAKNSTAATPSHWRNTSKGSAKQRADTLTNKRRRKPRQARPRSSGPALMPALLPAAPGRGTAEQATAMLATCPHWPSLRSCPCLRDRSPNMQCATVQQQ